MTLAALRHQDVARKGGERGEYGGPGWVPESPRELRHAAPAAWRSRLGALLHNGSARNEG
jgi:hypothetical protein